MSAGVASTHARTNVAEMAKDHSSTTQHGGNIEPLHHFTEEF